MGSLVVHQLILQKTTQDFVYLCVHLKSTILVLILMEITQHGNVLLFVLLEHKILSLTILQ